jgi:hypothetical protein
MEDLRFEISVQGMGTISWIPDTSLQMQLHPLYNPNRYPWLRLMIEDRLRQVMVALVLGYVLAPTVDADISLACMEIIEKHLGQMVEECRRAFG